MDCARRSSGLTARSTQRIGAFDLRINRLAAGNFGDCKSLGQGLYELRIDWGPGFRIYYAIIGQARVLLLCGGDKRTQPADIVKAHQCLTDYKARTKKK